MDRSERVAQGYKLFWPSAHKLLDIMWQLRLYPDKIIDDDAGYHFDHLLIQEWWQIYERRIH